MKAQEILAKNLRAQMRASAKYKDRPALASASGVAARTIGYMLQKTGNSTLKNVQAVAEVFKLEVWELLIDHAETKRRLISRIFDAEPAADIKLEKAGFTQQRKTTTEKR